MPARKPNFFIVGAPKCGTTSLAAWLDSHPEACMSRPKEPHYFSPSLYDWFKTLHDYENCFAHAQPHHKAIGEASTHTIYFADAIQKIRDYQEGAKFILCLRNPVEMAVSMHNELFLRGEQDIRKFLIAWNSQNEVHPVFLERTYETKEAYRHLCALGTHLRNLKEILPEDRLLTLLLDDLIEDEARELKKVTDFLDISPPASSFPRENVATKLRSKQLKHVAEWIGKAKQKLGIQKSLGIGRWIIQANIQTGIKASPMTADIRLILTEHFTPEIRMLENLLERDLSHWLAAAPSSNQ